MPSQILLSHTIVAVINFNTFWLKKFEDSIRAKCCASLAIFEFLCFYYTSSSYRLDSTKPRRVAKSLYLLQELLSTLHVISFCAICAQNVLLYKFTDEFNDQVFQSFTVRVKDSKDVKFCFGNVSIC